MDAPPPPVPTTYAVPPLPWPGPLGLADWEHDARPRVSLSLALRDIGPFHHCRKQAEGPASPLTEIEVFLFSVRKVNHAGYFLNDKTARKSWDKLNLVVLLHRLGVT